MEIGGKLQKDLKKKYNIIWNQTEIRYLGVIIPNNVENVQV